MIAAVALLPAFAGATDDYDVHSRAWNGASELVRVAAEADATLVETATLDWSSVRPVDGLLVLYPLATMDAQDVTAFLGDGGRAAVLDDRGDADVLFRWFRATRVEPPQSPSRVSGVDGILEVPKRAEHPLSEGVEALVTNAPSGLRHARMSPVFAFEGTDAPALVLAGEVDRRGRLVLGGDPSVLINTMLRFPGNRRFAVNLVRYLAGRPGGRVWLVHGRFEARGVYRSVAHPQSPLRVFVQSLDDALRRLGRLGHDPLSMRMLAVLLAALAGAWAAARTWGAGPPRITRPVALAGSAASVSEKQALFSQPRANLVYPALVARRLLERRLLRAAGLRPPADLHAVARRLGDRLTEQDRAALLDTLRALDALGAPVSGDPGTALSASAFLSLWRRIDAILPRLAAERADVSLAG